MEKDKEKIISPSGINKKRLKGVVVSDKTDKTVTVLVNRFIKHKRVGKFINIGKKYKAHDAENQYKTGDKVTIEECRSLSKDKHFKVVS